MSHWDSILDGLAEGQGVDCVYLDFSKAFDKVETGVLLHKLKDSRVLGKMGVWLGRFLDPLARKQAVAVEGRLSDLSPVISGVPPRNSTWANTVSSPHILHCQGCITWHSHNKLCG